MPDDDVDDLNARIAAMRDEAQGIALTCYVPLTLLGLLGVALGGQTWAGGWALTIAEKGLELAGTLALVRSAFLLWR